MPLESLRDCPKKVIGTKQTVKAVEKGLAERVFVATDAEEKLLAPVVAACERKGVALVRAGTMADLGKACGIEVRAAAAAMLR